MLFATSEYALFLPLTLALFWTALRLGWLGRPLLLVASLAFYGMWNPQDLPVLLAVIAVAWLGGRWLVAPGRTRPRAQLAAVLVVLFLPLFVFKYLGWIVEMIAGPFGWSVAIAEEPLRLPVGVSFFTFQAAAYVVDVSRGELAPRRPGGVALFVGFFPQLIAGPIVRGRQLLPQLERTPRLRRGDVGNGLYRIAIGMIKKLVLADILGLGIVDGVFQSPGSYTGLEVAIALYAYTLQIYCDFSGYTDIALGSARLFGIRLPENFDRPLRAASVAEFWRRWHITLSNWVRDYIYIPLGGSRVGKQRWKVWRNILVSLCAVGVWHGAAWHYVVFGIAHGLGVAVDRWRRTRRGSVSDAAAPSGASRAWRVALTFHFVVLVFVLFRAPDLPSAWSVYAALDNPSWVLPRFSWLPLLMMLIGYGVHVSPLAWEHATRRWFERRSAPALALLTAAVVVLCVTLGPGQALNFIYFEF